MKRDEVFRSLHPEISEFAFDERVAGVFGDMLKRSVPGYGTLLSMIGVFAQNYVQDNSNIYDLGCSLGGATFAIANNVTAPGCTIHAVDNSEPMIEKLNSILSDLSSDISIRTYCDDIANISFSRSSLTVMNLTLQFLPPAERDELLTEICEATLPGGLFILAEKISDKSENELFTKLYYDFKRANDYSDLEISQKRSALENVLITDDEETHILRMKKAGFSRIERWFQTLNFRAYAAWKE